MRYVTCVSHVPDADTEYRQKGFVSCYAGPRQGKAQLLSKSRKKVLATTHINHHFPTCTAVVSCWSSLLTPPFYSPKDRLEIALEYEEMTLRFLRTCIKCTPCGHEKMRTHSEAYFPYSPFPNEAILAARFRC